MMVPGAVLGRVRPLVPIPGWPDLAAALLAGASLGLAMLAGWACDAATGMLLLAHHAAALLGRRP